MTDLVLVSRADGVLRLRLNRPEKKNALNRIMYARLADELEQANDDREIRAVLLCGQPGTFSSGNDLADFASFDGAETSMEEVLRFLRALVDLDKPLISVVDGLAVGIGTTVLFHCDLVYATFRSTFQAPFVDLGLVPEAGSSLLAPRLMGHGRAFALLILGQALTAAEASASGFLTEVTDEAEAAGLQAAMVLAQKPPEALRIARRLLRGDLGELGDRIESEAKAFADRLGSAEARAAFASFFGRK